MDLHGRLTWLLLLSTTLLSEPASGAWWNQPDGDPNSLWNKFSDWIKDKFQQKDAMHSTVAPPGSSPAPSSTPAQAETSPAPHTVVTLKEVVSSAPATATEEITTSAPEVPTTAEEASENTSGSNLSPAPLVGDVTTSAAEILSTLAEASTGYSVTEGDNLSPSSPSAGSTEPAPTPAPQSTVREATVSPTAELAEVSTSTVSPSTAPADITTASPAPADITPAPVENTTPGAAATTEPTTAENPAPSSPAPSVPPTPETTPIATTHPNTATTGSADLIPLPDHVRLMLLRYLNSLCQPRRPGMPSVTLEGCVNDPTCGNQHSSGQRVVQFHYRAPVHPRVCLRCKVSGCNTQPPPPPRPFPGNRLPLPPPRPFPGNRIPLPPPRPFPGNRLPLPPPRPFPGNRLPRPPPRPFPGNRPPHSPGFPGYGRRAKRSTSDGVVVVIVPQ